MKDDSGEVQQPFVLLFWFFHILTDGRSILAHFLITKPEESVAPQKIQFNQRAIQGGHQLLSVSFAGLHYYS